MNRWDSDIVVELHTQRTKCAMNKNSEVDQSWGQYLPWCQRSMSDERVSYWGLWSGLGFWCLLPVVSVTALWMTAASPSTLPWSNSVGTRKCMQLSINMQSCTWIFQRHFFLFATVRVPDQLENNGDTHSWSYCSQTNVQPCVSTAEQREAGTIVLLTDIWYQYVPSFITLYCQHTENMHIRK